MSEIKQTESKIEKSYKSKAEKGFKKIKPETNISMEDADNYINDLFNKDNIENSTIKDKQNEIVKSQLDISNLEVIEKKGGSYKDVFKEGEGNKTEVHHIPPDSVNKLEYNDGPCIAMDKEDHRRTASWGNSREAREYRLRQKELIDKGKYREAQQMDIEDIKEKFGDKYNEGIKEMNEYTDRLEKEGRI
jgi:hypothetical protein